MDDDGDYLALFMTLDKFERVNLDHRVYDYTSVQDTSEKVCACVRMVRPSRCNPRCLQATRRCAKSWSCRSAHQRRLSQINEPDVRG